MEAITKANAISLGGWDPRYAVVRAVVSHEDIAAALIDPNGDGGSIDLDEYYRDADGDWTAASSGGGAGDSAFTWSPHMVTTYGRTTPASEVSIVYCGESYVATADQDGWWLFATRSLDDGSMPELRRSGSSGPEPLPVPKSAP